MRLKCSQMVGFLGIVLAFEAIPALGGPTASVAPTVTPGPVTDPDGKAPERRHLPRVTLQNGGMLQVTGGEAYYEQAIVVWRAGEDAAIVQVGQVARGSNAKGRPGGDAAHRPTQLTLAVPGDYYFQCWHKVEKPGTHISEVPWSASAERLSGDHTVGYTLACDDTPARDDFNDIVAEIKPNR